jgi:hypothetical protein
MEMFITNLIINAELLAASQAHGGINDKLVMTFWTFKYATNGKWTNALSEMDHEGYFIDNIVWEKHSQIDPSWNQNFGDITNDTRTIVENGRWTL